MLSAFPAPTESQVTLANWRTPPFNRWSFQHVREIVPTAEIADDPERRWEFPRALVDLWDERFTVAGKERSVAEWLQESQTDGLIVLQQGAHRRRALSTTT